MMASLFSLFQYDDYSLMASMFSLFQYDDYSLMASLFSVLQDSTKTTADGIPVSLFPCFPVSVQRLQLDRIPVSLFQYNDYNLRASLFPYLSTTTTADDISDTVQRQNLMAALFPCFSTMTTT